MPARVVLSLPEPVHIALGVLLLALLIVRHLSHPMVRPRAVLLAIAGVIGAMTVFGWTLYALGLTD